MSPEPLAEMISQSIQAHTYAENSKRRNERTKNYRAMIFDFDDTLGDTSETLSNRAEEAVIRYLFDNGVSPGDIDYFDEVYHKPTTFFKAIRCLEGRVPPEIIEGAVKTYNKIDISNLELFTGAKEVLQYLHGDKPEILSMSSRDMEWDEYYLRRLIGNFKVWAGQHCPPKKIAIVTSGNYENQMKKIKMFGLDEIVDDVYIVVPGETKRDAYTDFMRKYGFEPEQVVVVEDKTKELVAANELGMETIWTHTGRHGKASVSGFDPSYDIYSITDPRLARFLRYDKRDEDPYLARQFAPSFNV